jgi:prepilin peptidase CpaA
MILQNILNFTLLALLVPAVWIDQKHHRIPNWLTGSVLAVGICVQTVVYGLSGLGDALGGMLLGFVILLLPYLKGGMAAGDVKLMAAVGACLGPSQALLAACLSLVVGGGIAMLLVSYRYYRESTTTVDSLLTSRFPYASAIAIGTSAALIIKESPWIL